MTTDGAADLILVLAGLGAVFLGLLLLIGATTAYLTRHTDDMSPSSQPADDSWSDDI